MKIKLTQKFVDRDLRCPDGKKQIEYCDTDVRGLYVLVSSSNPGVGTYYLRYKNSHGKTCHRKVEKTSVIDLKGARKRAKELKVAISKGKDPQADVKAQRAEITYSEFMEKHYFPYIEPRIRTAHTYRGMYQRALKPKLGNHKVSTISKQKIQSLIDDLRAQGKSNAYCNRHLALLKSSINVGVNELELFDIKNAAIGIKMLPESRRDRFLSQDELSRLLPVLLADDGMIAKIIRFLLATGLRLGECLNCKWDEIDFDTKMLSLPGHKVKSGKTSTIPLNSVSIQVLEECDRSFDHPFANPKTGKPYVSIKKGFAKLMDKAELKGVTAHILRHSFASQLVNNGVSLYTVQRLLTHSSSQVTERYAHLSPEAAQDASDTISETLMRAATGGNSNN